MQYEIFARVMGEGYARERGGVEQRRGGGARRARGCSNALLGAVVVSPARLPGHVDVVVGADVVLGLVADVVLPAGSGAAAAVVVLGLRATAVVLGLVADVALPVRPGAVAAVVVLGLPAAAVVLGLVADFALPVSAAALLGAAVIVSPTWQPGRVDVVGADVALPVGPGAVAALRRLLLLLVFARAAASSCGLLGLARRGAVIGGKGAGCDWAPCFSYRLNEM